MDELKRTQEDIHALSNSIQRFIDEDADHAIYRAPIIDWHHPQSYQQSSITGLKKFQSTVENERDYIDRLASSPVPPKDLATNAPHLLAVWEEVERAEWPIICISQVLDAGAAGQAKVDVVAGGGDEWIKVNTMKESRLMAEFREQDSYINSDYDSESDRDSSNEAGPSRQTRPLLTNSAIEQAAALYKAAQVYPRLPDTPPPRVKFVLNRLEGNPASAYTDSRVHETFAAIRALGVHLVLASDPRTIPRRIHRPLPLPTRQILLDLSVVVALCCDSTHQPLPTTEEELEKRFRPFQVNSDTGELELASHSHVTKDLRDQLEWEMQHPLIQELQERLDTVKGPIEFWVTSEVKSRLPNIADIIGGDEERRRARALFDGTDEFWKGSRWRGKAGILEGMRVRVLDDDEEPGGLDECRTSSSELEDSPFLRGFMSICQSMLEIVELQATSTPTPESIESKVRKPKGKKSRRPQTGFTIASRLPSAHTLRTFSAGFRNGWTVLTNNRGAVGKVIREMRVNDGLNYGARRADGSDETSVGAAIWVVNPSSLCEWRRKEVELKDIDTLASFNHTRRKNGLQTTQD